MGRDFENERERERQGEKEIEREKERVREGEGGVIKVRGSDRVGAKTAS